MLAIQGTTQQLADQALSLGDVGGTSPASPNVALSIDSHAASEVQSVRDEAPIEDAADQQAMQHGSGALESGTDSGRELHGQLGRRFNESLASIASANADAAAGKASVDPSTVQAEITPGTYAWLQALALVLDRLRECFIQQSTVRNTS